MIDLHPLAVHFPIALLSLYAFLQLIPPKITWKYNALFLLNSFLLIVGSAGLLLARQLGDVLEESLPDVTLLIKAHAFWATNATALFGIITIVYALLVLKKLYEMNKLGRFALYYRLLAPVIRIASWLFDYYIVTILGIVGFVLIMITGALGGAIVYGPTADPFVSFVYSWLLR